MNQRASPSEPPDLTTPDRAHPRTRYRGAFRISLGISALLHVVAIALYPSFFSGIPEADPRFGGYIQPLDPGGTELVNLLELPPDQEPETPPQPEEEPDPEVPVIPIQDPSVGIVAPPGTERPAEGPPGPTAAERIRPRAEDLRFWTPVDPERASLSPEEIMRLRFMAEAEAMNDSAAAAAARAARATDWTYTDEEGKRWGVSPGKLHLGDLTLPLPFGFGAAPGQQERAQDRLWAWDEIETGAARGAVSNSWKERDRAIRDRMNARRNPDTTRTGGGGSSGPN